MIKINYFRYIPLQKTNKPHLFIKINLIIIVKKRSQKGLFFVLET